MSKLLAAIANRRSKSIVNARIRYVEILQGDDPTLADELLEVMETLGKSQTDVASDLRIIANYRNIEQNLRDNTFKPEDLKAAEKALEDYEVETFRLERSGNSDSGRIWQRQKLQLAVNNLVAQRNAITGNQNRLYDLSKEHPLLLSGL